MNRELLIELLEINLYEFDPAGTDCNLNDVYDEYATEAMLIADAFIAGDSLKNSMIKVFDKTLNNAYNVEKLMKAYVEVNTQLL